MTAVVNTGDDMVMHGLHVSPDLDTVTSALAGVADPVQGWGLAEETWNVMTGLDRLRPAAPDASAAGLTWFRLGHRDLATVAAAWAPGRIAVRFDEDMAQALLDTPLEAGIPIEALQRLPAWGLYVDCSPSPRAQDSLGARRWKRQISGRQGASRRRRVAPRRDPLRCRLLRANL